MRSVLGALGLVLAAGACGGGDDPFSPTVENVAGTYDATLFTASSSSGVINLLALGATVHVILATDGTTTGQLFVPGSAIGGVDITEDLAGTWTLSGSTVTFSPTASTLIQDAEFTASQNSLDGEGTFMGFTLRLVLRKTG